MSTGARALGRIDPRQMAVDRDAARIFQIAMDQAAMGNFSEAIDSLHEVTKSIPDHLQAWKAKATLYRLTRNWKMADLCTETAKALGDAR